MIAPAAWKPLQRDPIYNALLAQLQALTAAPYISSSPPYGVQVVSRGFVPWDEADQQPAIYIVPVTEEATTKRGFPSKYLIRVDLYVYVRWIDDVSQGVTALAQTMDNIDYILSPVGPNGGISSDNGYVNTLGGLVQYCVFQGPAEISGGFLNKKQTIARIPLEMQFA